MSDMFLKLDGCEGESGDAKHGKEIEVKKFEWGAECKVVGKAVISDLVFTHMIDKSSPLLLLKLVMGEKIPNAVFTARRAIGGSQDYFILTMEGVTIKGLTPRGDGDNPDTMLEAIVLRPDKLKYEYKPLDGDKLGAAVTCSLDMVKNTASS